MSAGDRITNTARTEKQHAYFYAGLKLVGVVDFVDNGNTGSVTEGPLVDGEAGELMRPQPGINTGTIVFRVFDWEDQFQTVIRAAGLPGPEQLFAVEFKDIIEDYVEGDVYGGGKAKRKTLAVNPLASTTYKGFLMSAPKFNKADGTVTLNWRGKVSTG